MKRLLPGMLLPLLLGLTGCSLLPEVQDETKDWSAQRLFSAAKSEMADGNYDLAIQYYEKLETRYPFGKFAQQAQIDIAYAYYKTNEPESAIAACDRFIRLYPRHPNVDYAYYLKGLANFNRGMGLLERYLPRDASQRDPGAALQSFNDFGELTRRFPDSKYAEDAAQRMLYLRNNLAQHELHVAEYYMRRKAYVAAANRAKYVIENYPRAPAVPDALVLMAKAYKLLGLEDLAADALRVLKLNYPDNTRIGEVESMSLR